MKKEKKNNLLKNLRPSSSNLIASFKPVHASLRTREIAAVRTAYETRNCF